MDTLSWFIHLPAGACLGCFHRSAITSSAACVDVEGTLIREPGASGFVTHLLHTQPLLSEPQCLLLKQSTGLMVLKSLQL